jgi:hypothetical protein
MLHWYWHRSVFKLDAAFSVNDGEFFTGKAQLLDYKTNTCELLEDAYGQSWLLSYQPLPSHGFFLLLFR